MMKKCKQCGRNLDESCFRRTKSRSKGIYKCSLPSLSTMCRECEALNQRAYKFLKAIEDAEPYDAAALEQLRAYYQTLVMCGRPPLTAAARRLIGLEPLEREPQTYDVMVHMQQQELYEHIRRVNQRSYATFDEADEVHRRLTPRLREAGLYEDVNNMMDDWYMDL